MKLLYYRQKADRLFQLKCIELYGNRCELCGNLASETHHIYPKSIYEHLRYELENGVVVCRKCHDEVVENDKGRLELMNKIKNRRRVGWIEYLVSKSKIIISSFKNPEYYKNKLEELKLSQKSN